MSNPTAEDIPLFPECFEPQDKPVKAIKRKKYKADPKVVSALKGSLDTCTDTEWTAGVVVLWNKETNQVYTRPVFDRDKDLFDCLEIMKLRYMAVSEEGEDDDKD